MRILVDGNEIKELLERSGMEPGQFSEKSGVKYPTLMRVMKGGGTTTATAKAIAMALGVPLDQIRIRSAGPIPIPISAPSVHDDITEAVAKLYRIYQARQSHDPEAAQAWEWINGNLTMFCKGLANSPGYPIPVEEQAQPVRKDLRGKRVATGGQH